MKSIDQIVPNMDKAEIFEMPDVMIIGTAGRSDQKSPPEIWGECDSKGHIATLCSANRIIPNHILGWTGDCPYGIKSFTYMVSVFVPIYTIIPDGLDYRVLHKSLVGKGTFGKDLNEAVEEIRALGYEPDYGDNNGWNAELYIGGEPSDDNWSWLFPVKPINK